MPLFDLIPRMLSRMYRPDHPDAVYVNKEIRSLKYIAVLNRNNASMWALDDKCGISVGDPGKAVACLERQRRALVLREDGPVVAMDHDAGSGCIKLTPTMYLDHSIPLEVGQSFFRGRVFYGIKNAITQPSTAMRSVAELHATMSKTPDSDKSILLVTTDGGPEHNVKNGSVRVSLTALFLKGDFDLLIAVRTAPGHSWVNPVERVMSICNIGLNALAIARSPLEGGPPEEEDGGFEKIVKKCGSMAEVREAIDKHQGLGQALDRACQPVITQVSDRFKRLSLKEQPFQESVVLGHNKIADFFSIMSRVDGTLKVEETTQAALEKHPDLQRFWETHAVHTR